MKLTSTESYERILHGVHTFIRFYVHQKLIIVDLNNLSIFIKTILW